MLQTLKPYEVCAFFDPAIDIAESDWEGYILTRDIAKLTFKEGHVPTVFVCKPISSSDAQRIKGTEFNTGEIQLRCFQHSVMQVKNLETPGDVRLPAELKKTSKSNGPLWSENEINELFDVPSISDVGEVIRITTFLPPVQREYGVPLSLWPELLRIRDLAAEQAQNMAEQDGTHSSTQAQEAPQTGASGDAHGDATATAKATD